MIEILKALLFGVVEGITEWLPISSTGHLILLDDFVTLNMSDGFKSMFEVVIQLGAILAVVVLYWGKLWPFKKGGKGLLSWIRQDTFMLWVKVVIAILPSAAVGLPLDDWMDEHLHTPAVVAAMLIVYGVIFIWLETRNRRKPTLTDTADITLRTALLIGLFQALSLVPGTSRSGATIIGGMLVGCSRAAAAEFSFFLAIPTMAGASLIKMLKFGFDFTGLELAVLAVGCVTAFTVSVLAIRGFMRHIRKHNFIGFGWYRIALGLVVIAWTLAKAVF